jgi:hypothetical protein
MILFKTLLDRVNFSPDDVSVPSDAGVADAPVEVASEDNSPHEVRDSFENDILSSINKRGLFNRHLVDSAESAPEVPVDERPIGDFLDAEKAPQKDVKPPETEENAPQKVENEAQKPLETEATPPENQEPKAPEAPKTFEINGRQMAAEDVFKMAEYYDKIANEIDAGKQEIESAKKSPEMVLVEYMRKNPEARKKFQEIVSTIAPEVNQDVSRTEEQIRIERLESQIQQQQQADIRAQQEYRHYQEQQQIAQAFNAIDQRARAKAQELGVPEDRVQTFGHAAMSKAQNGLIPKTYAAIEQEIVKSIAAEAAYVESVVSKRRGEYVSKKNSAPPPPPVAGSTPSVRSSMPKGFSKDLRTAVADDLSQALKDL